jgi:transposase, IS30 family
MSKAGRTWAGSVQVEKQEAFMRLIAQGVNNSEACRRVGIGRRTGERWRLGRKELNTVGEVVHYPPVKIRPLKPRHPRYLSEHDRIVIADLVRAGHSYRAIGLEIGRPASTVSREVRRNSDHRGRYRPVFAEQAAKARACKPRGRRLAVDDVLRGVVAGLLNKRWSPEQVSHELSRVFVGEPARCLCTETIYQAIYDPTVGLTRPARRRRRHRRVRGAQRRGRLTAMRMIDQRPLEVENRLQAGHWEGDLIMGPANKSAIGTLVERTTRFLILLHMPEGVPTASTVRHAVSTAFADLPDGLRRTLTWDQGKELAHHQQITSLTGAEVFFCDPHSPWQRGSNENTNGLMRDYFPKGTDLSVHSAEELLRVATEFNERPRKTLAWSRPADLFHDALTAD